MRPPLRHGRRVSRRHGMDCKPHRQARPIGAEGENLPGKMVYLVVLEPRRKKGYCLLITAYHVEEEWSRRKIMREAEKNGALFVGPCG